jgi:hypothetical protein
VTDRDATRAAGQATVTPSTRDPIAAWLDVFIPLTGLRGVRAAAVRAELEDHLRSRVDDLLIGGMTEGEAVRRAVEELGATVELSRAFRTAHTEPRRRRVMQGLIGLAAAAGLGLGTWSVVRPSVPAGAVQPPTQTAAATGVATSRAEDAGPVIGVQIEADTVEEFFDALAASVGARALVAWETFNDAEALQPASPAPAVPTKGVPLSEVLELVSFTWQLESDDLRPAALLRHGVLTIASQSVQDARSIERREYDIGWVYSNEPGADRESEATVLRDTVQSMVARECWIDQGGSLGEIRVLGRTLIVSMPARHYAELESLLKTVRENEAGADAEAGARRAAAEETIGRQHGEAMTELEALLRDREAGVVEDQRLAMELAQLGDVTSEASRGLFAEQAELRARLAVLEIKISEARARLSRLSAAMHDARYSPLHRAVVLDAK